MKKEMNKKGEMTSKMLITVILLIVGFVILLFVYLQFGEGDVDREVCHQSAVFRGTLPDILDIKNLPSLKCKTRKVCITDKIFGKGDCEGELGKEYDTIRISKDKDKTEEEINRFVARELASCWAMMGKGKLQIFTRDASTKKRCSICSRIAFDKELKEKFPKVEGLGDYLVTREVPNQDVSYWRYLTNNAEGKMPSYDNFSTDEKAIVFMEVENSDIWESVLRILEAGGWGAIGVKTGSVIGSVFGPIGTGTGAFVGGTAGIVFGWIDGQKTGKVITGKEFGSGHIFIDYKGDALKKLECDSFESIS